MSSDKATTVRTLDEIRETGAGWVSEVELAWLCDQVERWRRRSYELDARLDSIVGIAEARTSDELVSLPLQPDLIGDPNFDPKGDDELSV